MYKTESSLHDILTEDRTNSLDCLNDRNCNRY